MEHTRNNRLYDSKLRPPLELHATTDISEGDDYIDDFFIDGKQLYLSANELIICFDIIDRRRIWSTQCRDETYAPIDERMGKVIVPMDTGVVCLNRNDGNIVWDIEADEFPKRTSDKHIFLRGDYKDPEPVVCRSKINGEVQWILEGLHGSYNWAAIENGIAVFQGFEGFHTCKEDTGDVLWHDTRKDWLEKHFAGKKYGPLATMGPLIDGKLFVGFEGGLLVSINVINGDLLWEFELAQPDCPLTIIHISGKLFFNIHQGWGKNNYITCVCANSGKLIYQSKDNITPAGCSYLFATNDYIIGGNGPYISFFDIHSMEFVWQYKHGSKENVFDGTMIPADDQLITFNRETKKIYWFKSKEGTTSSGTYGRVPGRT
jgi:outer membrane protein assembly factor BamB